jgi:hypothetical protein
MTTVSELPFNSFEEFLKVETHQLAVEPNSSQILYFKVLDFPLFCDSENRCIILHRIWIKYSQ